MVGHKGIPCILILICDQQKKKKEGVSECL